jgi:hypothetical protein
MPDVALRAPPRYLKKHGYAPNSGWDDRGEQPPLAVLQAFAAADSLPDWLLHTLQAPDVHTLNNRVW